MKTALRHTGLCLTLSLFGGSVIAQETEAGPGRAGSESLQLADSLGTGSAALPPQSDAFSFGEMLAGKAGVHMLESGTAGAAPQLMVRGLSSIQLPVNPYIFVDGVPVRYSPTLPSFLSTFEPTRFGFVNPNDVSDIRVVRQGESLSRLGGRGLGGAIYIETDRGEFGGTKVDFSANYGVLNADYGIDRMGSSQFRDYLRSYLQENGASQEEIDANPIFNTNLPQYAQSHDWLGMITRNATYGDYHIKLKGGDGDANYMFSVGYTGKEETLQEAGMERIGMRFNLDYKVSPRFEISNNLSYANTSLTYFEQGMDWSIHPVYVSATKAPFFHPYAYTQQGQLSRNLAGVDELGKSNPLSLVRSMKNDNEENRVDGLISARWAVAEGLDLNSSLAVNYYNIKEQQYRPSLGIINDLHRIRQNSKRNSSELMLISNTWLEKKGSLGARSGFTATAGVWVEKYEEKSAYARKVNAGTDDYETLEQGTVDSASSVTYVANLMSFYLRGRFDLLDERIGIDANLNLEGASRFGREGRWTLYPGLQATAVLLPAESEVSLDLQAGWGRSGNHALRGAYYTNLYYPANYFGYGGVYLGNVANENIRPEVSDTYDAGLRLGLLDGRLSLEAGYYYRYTRDLLTYRDMPVEIGLDPQLENQGDLSAQGLELGLDALLVQKEGISWRLYANMSTLKNRVESLGNGDVIRNLGQITGIAREGEALGAFYGYKVLGVFASAGEVDLNKADGTPYHAGDYIIEDLNGDGRITPEDRQVIGSALPELFGNFGTTLQVQRFSLDALFSFSSGNDIYNAFRQQMHLMKDYSNQSPEVSGRWKSDGEPGNGLSRAALDDPSSNGAASDLWVEDGSYLKLKRITLGYNVPVEGKLRFLSGLRLFLTAENLLTFTSYSGLDPEVLSVSDPLLRGVDFGASPLPRSFLFGLKASF